MTVQPKISLDEYLEEVARFCESDYGKRVRGRFQDARGTSELAMLAAPTAEELNQLRTAVAIMTPAEKQNAEGLSDEQIERLAADARVDPANLAIFLNGYALRLKRPSPPPA
ncbi:MAG: hypothetical protein ACYTAS_23370 [Planctomycetota bacterium]